MNLHFLKLLYVTCFALVIFTACDPDLIDISPERDNGVVSAGPSTAGLMINMAGDKKGLYAIGLNSGVWKTELDENGKFKKWKQLSQSPRYAHCIAVDPTDKNHIAVGGRKSDAIIDKNCGLWESFDGGNTFKRKSAVEIALCNNNIVNGVVITSASTILTSTPNGIGRKEKNASDFTFDQGLVSHHFTSIAMFGDWIVARTLNAIFISNTDGKTWQQHAIRISYPGQNFMHASTSGQYSVSIIKVPQSNHVFVYIPAVRNPNGPCLPPDLGIDPCRPTIPPSNPPQCNYSSLLVFNNQTGEWNFQLIRERGLGIGLGGRAFMKSFYISNPNLQQEIGANTNLFYCGAQNIFKAISIDNNGMPNWQNVTNARLCGESMPAEIHPDFWDLHLDPSGTHAWIGCDGGVYQTAIDNNQSTFALSTSNGYSNLNLGLHTQHVHEAFVAGGHPDGEAGVEKYAFGTQDNGGWESLTTDGVTNWNNPIGGDVNFVRGDQGNGELVVMGRNLQTVGIYQFDNNPPPEAKLGTITILYQGSSFQFIQTLATETPNPTPLLDAVVLTTLPVQSMENGVPANVPGPLGSGTGTVILRNRSFASNPDINISKGAGWEIEFNDLPNGTQRFLVAGGHADPTYFVIAKQGGVTMLFKRKKSEVSWIRLSMPAGVTIVPYEPERVQHGPVFVNPYNPVVIYVSCSDGIYRSTLARKVIVFKKDDQLTDLVANTGQYPLDRFFPGGNDQDVVKSNQSVLNSMYPISGVAFNRYKPEQVVAGSPFTGVFFKNGNDSWRDFSDVLPKPFTPVSSVNINQQGIYVTTEGRGMFKIVNY